MPELHQQVVPLEYEEDEAVIYERGWHDALVWSRERETATHT